MWAVIQKIITNFFQFFLDAFNAIRDWFVDLIYFVFDSILSFFQSIIHGIPVPAIFTSNADFWSSTPGQFLYLFHACKLDVCLAIIAAAYGIRFAMNLVPSVFTRV